MVRTRPRPPAAALRRRNQRLDRMQVPLIAFLVLLTPSSAAASAPTPSKPSLSSGSAPPPTAARGPAVVYCATRDMPGGRKIVKLGHAAKFSRRRAQYDKCAAPGSPIVFQFLVSFPHRIIAERLIHLLLFERGAKIPPAPCPGPNCLQRHREWFSLAAIRGFPGLERLLRRACRRLGLTFKKLPARIAFIFLGHQRRHVPSVPQPPWHFKPISHIPAIRLPRLLTAALLDPNIPTLFLTQDLDLSALPFVPFEAPSESPPLIPHLVPSGPPAHLVAAVRWILLQPPQIQRFETSREPR
ncbi:hypothetical protein DFH09DRAFT_1324105 [Mycena vulgaris]|nr:hypothetical protein DFH09DRAFT_1324105 [Mycena vulgaris]